MNSTKALGTEKEVLFEGTFSHQLFWPYGVDLLLATFDKWEAVSSELNGLQTTFPLILSPRSAPVVTAHAGREQISQQSVLCSEAAG